ncbi:ATP-binding protein, partial [Staphylococcus aureus]|nr:ATP-binding protein [Staphylococcus aureus]
DYNLLKTQLIPNLIELNKKLNEKKVKVVPSGKVLPLLDAREKALNQKKHVYEGLKEENYIKNPMVEFFVTLE